MAIERIPSEAQVASSQELMDQFYDHFEKSQTKGKVIEFLQAVNSLAKRKTP